MAAPVAIWLSGREVVGQADSYPLLGPQTQEQIAVVSQASRQELADAVSAMADVMPVARQLGSHVRFAWCRSIYEQLGQRADEFARCITLESGKPYKCSRYPEPSPTPGWQYHGRGPGLKNQNCCT